jgi:hypothetical protein
MVGYNVNPRENVTVDLERYAEVGLDRCGSHAERA